MLRAGNRTALPYSSGGIFLADNQQNENRRQSLWNDAISRFSGTSWSLLLMGFSLLLVMLILITPPAHASEANEYTTIVLTENTAYQAGENATLEIYFFHLDAAQDPDDINLALGNPENGGRYVPVDTIGSRVEEGMYRISFQITEDDVSESVPHGYSNWRSLPGTVRCRYDDSRTETSDTSDFILYLEGEAVNIDVSPDKPRFQEGDMVRFTILTLLNGTGFTPDTIEGTLVVNGKSLDVQLEADDVGEYHYDYQDPDDGIGKEVSLEVNLKKDAWDYQGIGSATIDLYQVWLNRESFEGTTLTGILGVSDQDGTAVVADVEFWYDYPLSTGEWSSSSGSVETGSDGTTVFILEFPGISDVNREVSLTVWTNETGSRGEGINQFVSTGFSLPLADQPQGNDLVVVYQGNVDPLPLSSQVTPEWKAYRNGEVFADSELYYFLPTDFMGTGRGEGEAGRGEGSEEGRGEAGRGEGSEEGRGVGEEKGILLAAGKAITDGNGMFSITLNTSDNMTFIHPLFKIDTAGRYGEGSWEEFIGEPLLMGSSFLLTDTMDITISGFGSGNVTIIDVAEVGQETGRGSAVVIPLNESVTEEEFSRIVHDTDVLGWRLLNSYSSSSSSSSSYENGVPIVDGGFTVEMGIPAFFPEDHYFVVLVTALVPEVEPGSGGAQLLRDHLIVDAHGQELDPFDKQLKIITDIPFDINADEPNPIVISILSNFSVDGVHVTLEKTNLLQTCKSEDYTNATGVVTCLIKGTNFSGDSRKATIWINATKDGYASAFYVQNITIHGWEPLKDMVITTNLPDVMDSMETRSMIFTVTSEGTPIPGVRVTINPVGSARSCKDVGITGDDGKIYCTLWANQVVNGNSSVILYLNGTRNGYNSLFFTQTIIIIGMDVQDQLMGPISKEFENGMVATVQASIVGEIDIELIEIVSPDPNDPHAMDVFFSVEKNGTGSIRWMNITVAYSTPPPGLLEEAFRLFTWDSNRDLWLQAKDTGVDLQRKLIYANVSQFGIYAPRELDDIVPPEIEHSPVKRADPDKALTIRATITDDKAETLVVTLYYRYVGNPIYQILSMTADGDEYSAEIPEHNVKEGLDVEYYIRASDGTNTMTLPGDPGEPFVFEVKEKEGNDEEDDLRGQVLLLFMVAILITLTILIFTINLWYPENGK